MKYLHVFENWDKIDNIDLNDYIKFRDHLVKFIENMLGIKLIHSVESWDDAHYYLPHIKKQENDPFGGIFLISTSHTTDNIFIQYRNVTEWQSIAKEDKIEVQLQIKEFKKFFEIMEFICNFPKIKSRKTVTDIGIVEFYPKDADEFIKYAVESKYKVFIGTSRFDL